MQAEHLQLQSVLTRPPIFDGIFSRISPATFIRFGRTCRVARDAVHNFCSRAFSINRHLLRFFSDPIGFRSLQARTGTLISGSNALQFFDRSFYPESDLDLYTHPGHTREVGLWLIHEGYQFVPSPSQEGSFEELVGNDWDGLARRYYQDIDEDMQTGQQYRVSGVQAIFSFTKIAAGKELKVQIMEAKTTPLQCILGFHSVCVMNVISYNAAYSLYPRATFEERKTLSLNVDNEGEVRALGKYAIRGWRIVYTIWPHEEKTSSFYLNHTRWVDDNKSWVIPLNLNGVATRQPSSMTSEAFEWDPVAQNSWTLERRGLEKLLFTYRTLKSTLFRYNYLVADLGFMHVLLNFIKKQGSMEVAKRQHLSPEEIRLSVTWWDSLLPGFRETHLAYVAEQERLLADRKKRMRLD